MSDLSLVENCQKWLKDDVFPLWTTRGFHESQHCFYENLDFEAQPQDIPRRAMVQSRQIYSVATGARMKVLDPRRAENLLERSCESFAKAYLLPSGACRHSVTADGKPLDESQELYTQAFALFALAQAFQVVGGSGWREKGLALVQFLRKERKAPHGGFTEIKGGKTLFQSNPHMHLFEAALAWMQVDSDPEWKKLAREIYELCRDKFVDPRSGLLAEHFQSDWTPELHEGRFVAEPGHHFEWAWLLAVYQDLGGPDTRKLRHQLYELATRHGVDSRTRLAVDEIWSNFEVKKSSARFWPQCERIKAAVKLKKDLPEPQQEAFNQAADEAMTALFGYLKTPKPGLWYDARKEDGQFTDQVPKASSLYHIINAMEEYVKWR